MADGYLLRQFAPLGIALVVAINVGGCGGSRSELVYEADVGVLVGDNLDVPLGPGLIG